MPPDEQEIDLDLTNDSGDITAEINTTDVDPVEIVVEDDTPPADRNRKPLDHDPLEVKDEAEEYTENVKKRIKSLTHKAHDERREKERAQRERDEAIRVAKTAYEEAQKLKKQLSFGESAYAGDMVKKAEADVASAKAKFRQAYEAGDPDALADAQESVARAVAEQQRITAWSERARQQAENALQQQDDAVSIPQHQNTEQNVITPDDRAVEWSENNKWYGKDPEMTSLAYGVHEKLIAEGIHPVTDAEEYYKRIDATMRRRFPEYQWGDAPRTTTRSKPNNVVAPVSRTAKGNKVTLSATQVALANKLGITPEQYARELIRMQKGA